MKLSKSRENILEKFTELIALAAALGKETRESPEGIVSADRYFELRVSALNLLSVICGSESVYLKEISSMPKLNAFVIKGVLEAASVVSLTLLYGSSPLIRHPCESRDPG